MTDSVPEERLSAERRPMTPHQVENLRVAIQHLKPGERWSNPNTIPALIATIDDLEARLDQQRQHVEDVTDERNAEFAEACRLTTLIDDLTAERDAARERGAAYEREAAAWSKGVGEFVDEFAPTYCAEAACGPADLLPALPEIAERIRDRVRRAAADTPKLQAAQAWVDARRERDRLLSVVRNKSTRREFFRGAEALDVAEEALAAAFTEEPEGPTTRPASVLLPLGEPRPFLPTTTPIADLDRRDAP